MATADYYRKRAKALVKGPQSASAISKRTPIGKKHKALLDMADNADWLDGVKTKPKP